MAAGFRAPPLPYAIQTGVAAETPPAAQQASLRGLFWFWGGGGELGASGETGGETPALVAYYIPVFRPRRR